MVKLSCFALILMYTNMYGTCNKLTQIILSVHSSLFLFLFTLSFFPLFVKKKKGSKASENIGIKFYLQITISQHLVRVLQISL